MYEPPKAMKATIGNGKRPFPHMFPTKLTTSRSILKSKGPLMALFGGDDGVVILSTERGTIDKLNNIKIQICIVLVIYSLTRNEKIEASESWMI